MRKLKNEELNRKTLEEFKKTVKIPITIVLDNVRSALNVGSIFRIADAFLIKEVILCGITASPPNKDIRKVALGSTLSVNWKKYDETLDVITDLKNKGFYIVGVEQTENSTELEKFNPSDLPIAIIFGHEVNGVSQKVIDQCDEIVEIPQYGTKHSLNISVSAGITVWEISKKLMN
tara:strand:- start:1069 stop:1596 length:528 start_codon:yes stop_codon:yes gene_type:complete